jgi:hypothetical protein
MFVWCCTILCASGDYFHLFNTGLKLWPHKQHRYHYTRSLVLTQEQNKVLRNNIESSKEKYRVTRWRSWLRHCTTSRKVEGSIPDGFIGVFGRTMALGSTQSQVPGIFPVGVKAAGA